MLAYLAEGSGGAVLEGAEERATGFVRRALVAASNGDISSGDCPAWLVADTFEEADLRRGAPAGTP
eukprot:9115367-Alexandrium_andersonii.AAC.1